MHTYENRRPWWCAGCWLTADVRLFGAWLVSQEAVALQKELVQLVLDRD